MTDIKAAEYKKEEVTIDDEVYYFEDLPEQVRHSLVQIGHTRAKIEELELETQRYNMMQSGYVSLLREGMEEFKQEA
jgi:hypothetical protein|tara:strand:+ start:1753 stop:1983 length:231 start_codon:yes stop_codon:yes gene_type:complete